MRWAALVLTLVASAWAATADVAVTVAVGPLSTVTMTEARTADSNGDGLVDQLIIQFSAAVDVVDPGGAGDGLPCLALSGGYIIASGDYTATGVMSLTINLLPTGGPFDTDALITATHLSSGGSLIRLTGAGALMADGATAPAVDGARPVVIQILPAVPAVVTDPDVTLLLTFSEPVNNLATTGFTCVNAVATSVVRTGANAFSVVITPQVTGTFSVTLSNGAVTDLIGNLSRATATMTRQWFPPTSGDGFVISGARISGHATGSRMVAVNGVDHVVLDGAWSGTAALPGPDPKLIQIPVLLFGRWGFGEMITIDILVVAPGSGS